MVANHTDLRYAELYGYTVKGFEALAPTTATELTVPAGSTKAVVTVETNPARYRFDGTTTPPTATVGHLAAAGDTLVFTGGLDEVEFIDTAAGASVVFERWGFFCC